MNELLKGWSAAGPQERYAMLQVAQARLGAQRRGMTAMTKLYLDRLESVTGAPADLCDRIEDLLERLDAVEIQIARYTDRLNRQWEIIQ